MELEGFMAWLSSWRKSRCHRFGDGHNIMGAALLFALLSWVFERGQSRAELDSCAWAVTL